MSSLSNDSLLAILELHVLAPLPVLQAPWTVPFLAAAPSVLSWLGANLTAATANSASSGYMAACKCVAMTSMASLTYATPHTHSCGCCRSANVTVRSGSGPAANIVVADVPASKVSCRHPCQPLLCG